MGMVAFALGTVGLHRLPTFAERGIEPIFIAIAIAWDAVLAGVGTFVFGMLGHRVSARVFGALGFALLAVGTWMTIYVDDLVTLFTSLSIWGVGIGGMMYMNNIVWAEYFGRAHVGTIRGFVMPFTLLLGAIGAPAAGYVFDITGTYDPVWWASTLVFLGCAALMLFTPPPGLSPTQSST